MDPWLCVPTSRWVCLFVCALYCYDSDSCAGKRILSGGFRPISLDPFHHSPRAPERRSRRQTSEVFRDFGSLLPRVHGDSLTDGLARRASHPTEDGRAEFRSLVRSRSPLYHRRRSVLWASTVPPRLRKSEDLTGALGSHQEVGSRKTLRFLNARHPRVLAMLLTIWCGNKNQTG